jgi:hypothetical protein
MVRTSQNRTGHSEQAHAHETGTSRPRQARTNGSESGSREYFPRRDPTPIGMLVR